MLYLKHGPLIVRVSSENTTPAFGCANGPANNFRKVVPEGVQTFVPFAGGLNGEQRSAYLGADGLIHYCASWTNDTGSVISGLSDSWTGFVAWASGDFVATR